MGEKSELWYTHIDTEKYPQKPCLYSRNRVNLYIPIKWSKYEGVL